MRSLTRWDIIAALKLRLSEVEDIAKDKGQSSNLRRVAWEEAEALRASLRRAELEGLLETLPTAWDNLLRLPSLNR